MTEKRTGPGLLQPDFSLIYATIDEISLSGAIARLTQANSGEIAIGGDKDEGPRRV